MVGIKATGSMRLSPIHASSNWAAQWDERHIASRADVLVMIKRQMIWNRKRATKQSGNSVVAANSVAWCLNTSSLNKVTA